MTSVRAIKRKSLQRQNINKDDTLFSSWPCIAVKKSFSLKRSKSESDLRDVIPSKSDLKRLAKSERNIKTLYSNFTTSTPYSNLLTPPSPVSPSQENVMDISCNFSVISDGDKIKIPIVGYEVMEERSRFTIFKLRIENYEKNNFWLVLRRFTDFTRLHTKLKSMFPDVNLVLPKKKWFGNNFSSGFLDTRITGLQTFINDILGNSKLRNCAVVREFFCLDDPPMYSESMEECKAIFEAQEEMIANLKLQLKAKDETRPEGSQSSTPQANSTSSAFSLESRMKYISYYNFPYCDESVKYEKVAKIGQGTFGEVFKARAKNDTKFVAMKRVLMENEKEGFPITALREIRILQLLKHENVVNLIEICRTKANKNNNYKSIFYLVFDFCEHDLAGLLSNVNVKFSLGEIKKVMKQLLNGLYYIHSNKILHRDMKAANVLITKTGVLKLADFGLARAISISKSGQPNRYTNRVVTLWYRPPELLLGDRNYGPPVDMWGAGCIMAEMWTRSPIMQGATEQQQLTLCAQLCGSFTPEVWPGLDKLDLYPKMELPLNHKRKVKERLRPYVKDPHAVDLLDQLLILNPEKRINADDALMHDFFWTDPMPSDLGKMLSQLTQSNFEFLAPPRRSTQMMHRYQQQTANAIAQRPQDNSYQDRVY
ncbi:CLUMA_CG021274, isoform A [Clunio marinus]|uniref:CLUMA_CG021274, isoform A n=1 Tax=Clunio marinus TaxID=568069 RepID=A0A1J1J824_9DIPT|nr:CLUMA_CG021274, isoform A [Clunio marinus]